MHRMVSPSTVISSKPSTQTAWMLAALPPRWARHRSPLKMSRRNTVWKKNGLLSVGGAMFTGNCA